MDELTRGSAEDALRTHLRPPELLDELVPSGEKHTLDDVVAITRTSEGKLIWLETGNERAGLQHIVSRHAEHFVSRGISPTQIPELIIEALENGTLVDTQGRNAQVYEILFNGKTQRVAIVVSDNGFIVTARPDRIRSNLQ